MATQTIRITPDTTKTITEIMTQVNALIPSSVQSFINQCYADNTLVADITYDDELNAVTIIRTWDPSVIEDYKQATDMTSFVEGIEALGWAITINPANVDL